MTVSASASAPTSAPTSAIRNLPVLAKRQAVLRSDSDFLPAALELLETPPSPSKTAFAYTICALVTAAIAWSSVGRIDIIAMAQGKMQPTGRVKIIQPSETGKVKTALVRNGDAVKAGQALVELDDTDARADEAAAKASLVSWRAEILRRQASLATAADATFTIAPIAWPSDIPLDNQNRESRILAGDVAQITGQIAGFTAQIHQKQAEKQRLESTLASDGRLLQVLQARVTMKETLVKMGAGPLTALLDAQETYNIHASTYAATKGQIEESAFGIDVLAQDSAKAVNTFVADNRQKLADAERQADDLLQKLAKTRAHLDHLTLKSPIDGVIVASTVINPGQVVTTGDEIMRVVPDNAALEIEAYLKNEDAGFVHEGQDAIVKLDAFPFTRYGTIHATVVRVAKDAIPEQDAGQTEGDPARGSKSSGFAGAQRTQNLVYPITLTLVDPSILVDGRKVALASGMAATVEVQTGSRRIIEFLFSPLVETASHAFKER